LSHEDDRIVPDERMATDRVSGPLRTRSLHLRALSSTALGDKLDGISPRQ
jgi:hypothetical protein